MAETAARMQVAVGVVFDPRGERVLLARRPAHVPHGGLWEFPGGKRRPGESRRDALGRELLEELNIVVHRAEPLIGIDHEYPDAAVHLDVWRVDGWTGAPCGREGQELDWVPVAGLRAREFPAANRSIVSALELPPLYLITPDLERYDTGFMERAEAVLTAGVRLLQFRSRQLPASDRPAAIAALATLCRRHDARLVVNGSVAEALQAGAHGIHLTASRLLQCNERPLASQWLVAASCHNSSELDQAARLALDFTVLGPVSDTATHPEAEPLGWEGFAALADRARLPVYALGGLGPDDSAAARRAGGQGVSMISGIWEAADPAAAVRTAISAG